MLIIAFVCKGIQIIPSDKVIGLFLLFYSLHADGVMTLLMTPVKEISFDLALELIAQTGTEQALFTNTGLDESTELLTAELSTEGCGRHVWEKNLQHRQDCQ